MSDADLQTMSEAEQDQLLDRAPPSTPDFTRRQLDGHRLSEFIYGTVIGMIAIAGVSEAVGYSWWAAAAVIVLGAVAIWTAHAYALLLGHRIATGRRMHWHDVRDTFAASWPIVTAGLILAAPLVPAALGLWSVPLAMSLGSDLGIAILAIAGYVAGVLTHETLPRRLLMALASAALGGAIVFVEFLVRHAAG